MRRLVMISPTIPFTTKNDWAEEFPPSPIFLRIYALT